MSSWLVSAATGILLLGCCSALQPEVSESHRLGMAALRSGEYDTARKHFEQALESGQHREGSQAGLLRALREVGRYTEARNQGRAFLAQFPAASGVSLETARSSVLLGDYHAAEVLLRDAVGLGGDSKLEVAGELALLLEATGRRESARELWNTMISQFRTGRIQGSRKLGNIAVAAWQLGWIDDARDIFVDATTAEPVALESLSNFGYLFLEKYVPTEALALFRECLEINPHFSEALLGIALAKRYESNAEVEKYAHRALETNPNFSAALNLLAEIRMQAEKFDDAWKLIEKALRLNPNDLQSLSLKAVYYHHQGAMTEFAQVEKKVLDLNSHYGRLYYTIAESLVSRRKYAEAVQFNRRALSRSPDLWSAQASLGMNLMRVGEVPEGRRVLERCFKGDSYNIWVFNTLNLLDQMEGFTESRSPHFSFKMSQKDHAVMAPHAHELAEEAFDRLVGRYKFIPEGPIQVEIFPDPGGFSVRTLGLTGLGALGVCFGKVIAQDSPLAREGRPFNWGSTLWHEFAHVITLQMTRHNIPRWFSEGISVYEERRAKPGWGDDLTAAFVKAYQEDKLLKVSELNTGMMRPRYPEQIAFSYYQASLVCELIEERFGFEAILKSLNLFAEKRSTEEVFREALGWSMETFDQEYASYLDSRMQMLSKRLGFAGLEKTRQARRDREALKDLLEESPDDFFANLFMGRLLREKSSNEEAERYLLKAKGLFPEFVEPENPYQILADMYLEADREEEALGELLAWTQYDENAAGPLRSAAGIYRQTEHWGKAAELLERAVYINPHDPRVHRSLGEAAEKSGVWRKAVAAYQVLVALKPVDQAGAHLRLARAWLGSGDRRSAKQETLRALEIAPSFDDALDLLLKLHEENP